MMSSPERAGCYSKPLQMKDDLGRRKLWIAFGDPSRGRLQSQRKTRRKRVLFCFTFATFRKRAFIGVSVKQKTVLSTVFSGFGGERGIRTPGPPIGGQRFSRPPHSTALPFLPLINEPHAAFDRGVYPAPRDHFSLSFPVRRKDNIFLTFWNFYLK